MLNSNFLKMFKERLNLRKVATIVTCLVVTAMLASCDNKNPDDDDGNGGGKIDHPIVGIWSSRPYTPVENSNTWIEFKEDGTFTDYIATIGGTVNPGRTWTTGKFRIKDDVIYCTNVKYSYKAQTGGGIHDYTDRPGNDFELTFSLETVDRTWGDYVYTNILLLGIYRESIDIWNWYYHPD